MTKDPDVLKHEIDELQERVKKRSEQIGRELSPRTIASDALDKVFSDPSEAFNRTTRTIANHPVAATVATAGLLSLAGAYLRETRSDDIDRLSGKARRAYDDASRSVSKRVAELGEKASDLGDDISSSARSAAEKAREAVASGRKKAEETYDEVSREAASRASAVARQSKQAARSTRTFVEDNPLAAGLIAVAAGAALASVFAVRSNRRDDDDEELTPATRQAMTSTTKAKPKVTQAKKSERAKSTPNKVTKSMKTAESKRAPKRKSPPRKKAAKPAASSATAAKARTAGSAKQASGNGVVSTH